MKLGDTLTVRRQSVDVDASPPAAITHSNILPCSNLSLDALEVF